MFSNFIRAAGALMFHWALTASNIMTPVQDLATLEVRQPA